MSEDHNKRDPIERLFESKAGDYDISYNEGDWLELEKRLDMLDKQYAAQIRRRWIAAACLLLFSLLGYFTYQNHSDIGRISRQLDGDTAPNAQQERTEKDTRSGRQDRSTAKEKQGASEAEDHVAENQNADKPPKPGQKEQNMRPVPREAVAGEENTEAGAGNSLPFLVDGESARALFVAELSCPQCGLSKPGVEDLTLAFYPVEPLGEEPGIAATGVDTEANSAERNQPAQNIFQQITSRLAMGLVVSPDLSTVGSISNFYDPGYKVGVTLEYQVSRNVGMVAGIMQSDIRYLAQGREYKPPRGFWTNGTVPNETAGECTLLDIPISLKYNFLQLPRSRFFGTAGLSSYIMLNEKYRFDYDSGDPGLVQGWNGKTGTRHWMSNAGFSIGYELDIHPNWSLRAEPYVKIPLKEVGWGNVNLYSIGSLFSLNYRFHKAR